MNLDFETIQQYVTLGKDIITGLSAMTAAIIAILGLHAWKKQIKGKTEYELAQRFLRATYRVREALAGVRNPFQSSGEIAQAMQEANIEGNPINDPQIHSRSEGAVYQKRWQKVQEAFVELESVALEAEVIWDQPAREKLKPLQQCSATLLANIQMHLRNMENPPRNYNRETEQAIETIIYGWPDNPNDNPFSKEIAEAVGKMEGFLRQRLKL